MVRERQLRTVLEGGSYFEGPRWHDGTWWVSDFYRRTVSRVTPDGAETVVLEVKGQPSGLGWLPDGALVVTSMKDRRILRVDDGEVSTLAEIGAGCGGHATGLVRGAHGHGFVGAPGIGPVGGGPAAPTLLKRGDPDGALVVTSMKDRRILRVDDGEVSTLAEIGAVCGGHANDLVVDAHGHVFVGDLAFDLMGGGTPAPTSLKRVDPDGSVHVVAEGMWTPNGMAITADGGTLLVDETLGNRITAFDLRSEEHTSE